MKPVFGGSKLVLEYIVRYEANEFLVYVDVEGLEEFTPRYKTVEVTRINTDPDIKYRPNIVKITEMINDFLDAI